MTQSRPNQPIPTPDEGMGFRARLRLGAGGVAIAALVLFFVENLQEVRVRFLWFDLHTPLIFALFASAAMGGVTVGLMSALRRRATTTRGSNAK